MTSRSSGFAAIPAGCRRSGAASARPPAPSIAARPDVLVIIDSPDFTHRVARRVRAAAPAIPIVDYVSPTVWAWRPGRARAMRRYVDHVLALLPFEPDGAPRGSAGRPAPMSGHPLVEQVGDVAARSGGGGAARRRRRRWSWCCRAAAAARSGASPIFGAAIAAGRRRHPARSSSCCRPSRISSTRCSAATRGLAGAAAHRRRRRRRNGRPSAGRARRSRPPAR